MMYEKADCIGGTPTVCTKNSLHNFWNEQIMERFIKANLFIICCIAAGLLLIVYLGAFSCEVSWILEAHGDLPYSAYILCTQYFIVFVATTILIHGLVTGLSWGLFAWSAVIGLLSIPELVFVMIMTTQHWGLQSIHGLTELISYLIRLVINCFALICVIPTGLKWRRESQVLSQLQDLATRLQLQTPPPAAPMSKCDSRRSSKRLHTGIENVGYQLTEPTKIQMNGLNSLFCAATANGIHNSSNTNNNNNNIINNNTNLNNNNALFGSQNEFNASIFATPYMQQYNSGLVSRNGNRAQSLMDLRCTLPGMYNPRNILETDDKNEKYFNITIDDLKSTIQDSNKTPSLIGSVNDPIYCSIEPKQATPPPPPLPHSKYGRHSQPSMMHSQHIQNSQHHHHHKQQHQQQQQQQQSYQSQKMPGKLSRNCISLENLDGIAKIQNDLAFFQNFTEQQQQYYFAMLNGYMNPIHASHLNIYRRPLSIGGYTNGIVTPVQPMQRRNSHQMQYYGSGFDYTNYTNPYITANSKLSLGNESDDYRRYRDVAL